MGLITITCPHCGFSKQVEQEKIPENLTKVTCKHCQNSFPLPAPEPDEAEAEETEPANDSAEFTFLADDPKAEHIQGAGKFCPTCGEKLHLDAEICPQCGVRQPAKSGAINKVALLLITFFLGGLGGHKFYQKKYGLGVLYLLFFWTYIPGLVALIEFFIYAFKSEAELQKKYPEGSATAALLAAVLSLVGIAIIGILAAIAIPQFAAYRQKAYDAVATEALKSCKNEAEIFFLENQSYPISAGQIDCQASPDVALYYLSLGPEEYQVISFHGKGQKAFLSHSSGNTIEENTRLEIERQLQENFGSDVTERSFHFLQ